MALTTTTELLAALGKLDTATDQERAFMNFIRPAIEDRIKKEVRGPVELKTFTELYPEKERLKERDELVDFDKSGQRVLEYRGKVGGGMGILQLRQTPVRQIITVWEDWYYAGALQPTAPVLDPANYFLDFDEPPDPANNNYGLCLSGQLVKPYYWWSTFPRSIKVRYVAGYTPAELLNDHPAFRECVFLVAAKVFRTFESMWDQEGGFKGIGPVASEGMDGMNFSYDMNSVRQAIGQAVAVTSEVRERLEQYKFYGGAAG